MGVFARAKEMSGNGIAKSKRRMESHLRPATGPVLNGIALFEFHLFSNGQSGAAVIAKIGAGDGLGDGLVDTASASWVIVLALWVPVGGLSTVAIGEVGRFFEVFGNIDEWRGISDHSFLLLRSYTAKNPANAFFVLIIYRHFKSRMLRCSER